MGAGAACRLLLALHSPAPPWRLPAEAEDELRREFPELAIASADSREALEEAIADADILLSWAPGEPAMARAGRLRWVHSPAAGIGAYLTPSFRTRGVLLTNSRGVHAVPIAEHVIGTLVALARRFRRAVVEQTTTGMARENWWSPEEVPDELHGKTLGLFGYGAIGRETARRALALGMRVIALRRRAERPPAWDPELLLALGLPAEEPAVTHVYGPRDFDRFLEASDAVAITAALTPETEGAFGAAAFARMKPGAWLLNVARGKIVREAELVEALRTGRLGGAALDVFEREPLPRESLLYTLDRVILTPHVSGLSRGFWPRALSLFRANVRRWLRGEPLLNRVDPERGY